MLESLTSLRARELMLCGELEKVQQAVHALQALCQHDWEDDGHNHRDTFKRCAHCGLKRISGQETDSA